MAIKAVFFDFDDTLVLTKQADEKAFLQVRELARRALPEVLFSPVPPPIVPRQLSLDMSFRVPGRRACAR